ncbi:hypothetical protein [Streptomyces milbemycinicus]|uniref:hypothetical protein n=1 Tax=Streptomyces milbemycinicus TaxID=476552 RepID=UPI0033C56965
MKIRTAIARACAVTKAAIDRMRPKRRAAAGPTTAPTRARPRFAVPAKSPGDVGRAVLQQ